jgi:3'(2'), 5'-bisphosphate nucleotidase
VIVVEEAGGKVTDVAGDPLDFTRGRTLTNNRGVIVTNGLLHEAIIDTVRAVGVK